jgi:hypothetical protein
MGRPKKVPVPIPDAPSIKGADREAMALWMKERAQELEDFYQERIELLRTVGEHPSPIFARIVRTHGALGMPKRLLARLLGITQGDLKTFYEEEYELGELEALSSVAANAMRIASSASHPDAARVAVQVLDRRGGEEWKPPAQKLEVNNPNNAPPVIDSSKLTSDERQQLRQMLTRIAGGGEGEPLTEEEAPQPGVNLIE